MKSESMVGRRLRWRLILGKELLSDSLAAVMWMIFRISGGEVEKGRELAPIRFPAAADGGLLRVVGGAEGLQRGSGDLFGRGARVSPV